MKKLAALGLAFLLWASTASAQRVQTYTLFGGSDVDSTEQYSAWIPVHLASRVYIRTWSAKAAFHASTDADSTYSDSLITFTVLLSDSSGGRLVGPGGQTSGSGADSVLALVTAAGDTARVMIGAMPLPVNKTLRGPANGSGLVTVVYPTQPGSAGTAGMIDVNGRIPKKWLRVRCTPLRRMTVTGSQSTEGKRVNGLKGFRMTATVVTPY